MKVRADRYGHVSEQYLEDFFSVALESSSQDQVYRAQGTADKAVEGFGRLCNVLADKGILNAEDIKEIIGVRYDISFIESAPEK